MNLVDSSGWLEYFADGKNAEFFAPPIQDIKNLAVSTINIYEVFKKILEQKDENGALEAIAVMQQARVIDLNSTLALSSAGLSYELKLPMAIASSWQRQDPSRPLFGLKICTLPAFRMSNISPDRNVD
jgi:toxin FitB